MKKSNNKGFSLVELIVVVAIMAVLVGVLAPAYLRYVEKTRLQKDNSAIAEVAQAMKLAAAEEDVNDDITSTGLSIVIGAATADAKDVKSVKYTDDVDLDDAVKQVVAEYTTTSNTYKNSAKDITLTIKNTDGKITVTAVGYIENVGDTASTSDKPFAF